MTREHERTTRPDERLFVEGGEDGVPAPVISELRALAGQRGRVSVRVGGLRVARLRETTVASLGLHVGQEWTPHLAVLVAAGERADLAAREGEKFVSRRARSEASTRAHLRAKGHDEAATDEALARLRAAGAVDDGALAKSIVRGMTRRGPASRRAALEKGVQAGVPGEAMERALAGLGTGEEESAVQVVREKLPTWLEAHGPEGSARRALALLARKGYEREDAERAVRVALEERGAPAPEDWA